MRGNRIFFRGASKTLVGRGCRENDMKGEDFFEYLRQPRLLHRIKSHSKQDETQLGGSS